MARFVLIQLMLTIAIPASIIILTISTTTSAQPDSSVPTSKQTYGSGKMFDGIASTYDTLNKIISLGMDQMWRQNAIDSLQLSSDRQYRILDVATGTADVAILVAKRMKEANIVGIDPSEEMLHIGNDKVVDARLKDRVELVLGEAEHLPFGDEEFDAVTVSFGVRNFGDRVQGLSEIARVMKSEPHARLAILEISEPKEGMLAPLAKFFIHHVMPYVANLVSGHLDEYSYLKSSLVAFPSVEEFEQILAKAGLELVFHDRLAPWKCGPNLYVAKKIVVPEKVEEVALLTEHLVERDEAESKQEL